MGPCSEAASSSPEEDHSPFGRPLVWVSGIQIAWLLLVDHARGGTQAIGKFVAQAVGQVAGGPEGLLPGDVTSVLA